MSTGFSSETTEAREVAQYFWSGKKQNKQTNEKQVNQKIPYPVKLSFKNESEIKYDKKILIWRKTEMKSLPVACSKRIGKGSSSERDDKYLDKRNGLLSLFEFFKMR